METYQGIGLFPEIAIGKIYCYRKKDYHVTKKQQDIAGEKKRLEEAFKEAQKNLSDLYEEAIGKIGKEQAMIFEIHRMLLADAEYKRMTEEVILQGICAEYAVETAMERIAGAFESMDDVLMKARAADIRDVSKRVIRILTNTVDEALHWDEKVILFAEDLTPSETIRMDQNSILAIVTVKGSVNSHASILAKSMGIPAIVNVPISLARELDGKMAVVDGFLGEVVIEPTASVLQEAEEKKAEKQKEAATLEQLIGMPNISKDGKQIDICANIGSVSEAEAAIRSDAGGIGLFRSEYLYIGRTDFPSEEEQFIHYKEVLEKMQGKKVIFRTLDIGADKTADYFQLEKEENPALGLRAIRICLLKKDIFMTQLRAIYRAAVYGNAKVMFPMITSADEIRQIKEVISEVKATLLEEGKAIGNVRLGIMIETPAAALLSEELAKEVDFFSIGTNDLTQYTLAMDRQNPTLSGLYDMHHPAVMKLIEMTVANGHKAGIHVGICGELAADTSLTKHFLMIGVDELSVTPAEVLRLRKTVREC